MIDIRKDPNPINLQQNLSTASFNLGRIFGVCSNCRGPTYRLALEKIVCPKCGNVTPLSKN